jgi:dienelactone hydrolase
VPSCDQLTFCDFINNAFSKQGVYIVAEIIRSAKPLVKFECLEYSLNMENRRTEGRNSAHREMNARRIKTAALSAVLFFALSCGALQVIRAAGPATAPQAEAALIRPEKITFPSSDGDAAGGKPTPVDGYLYRPEGKGPFPAIVALHGCSGLLAKSGKVSARFADWAQRLTALGYVVLFPDSFTPRRISGVCSQADRSGFSARKERAGDANGALLYLQSRSFVHPDLIALLGWSHGGSTLLAAIDASSNREAGKDFRTAIAFYPGCTGFQKNINWLPRVPLTILIGEEDDWTPAASCRSLVERSRRAGRDADIVVFPHAYHAFDHPDLPLRTRKGLAFTVRKDGTATIGTNPEARAAAIELVPKILRRHLQEKGTQGN